MRAYGLYGGHAAHISKGRERFGAKQEAQRQYNQMVNDYYHYIWSDEVDLCIYCRTGKNMCGDCEYWNDVMNKAVNERLSSK